MVNFLDRYSVINNYVCESAKVEVFKPPEKDAIKILSDVKTITIAEITPASRDLITAHKLKDYRRKTFSLLLLPDIDLPIDSLLGELPQLSDFTEFDKVGV